jgi:hypothetical protein
LALIIPGSCGIEDYKYLEPIDAGDISRLLNTKATIRIRMESSEAGTGGPFYYFRNFIIYYRIYISDLLVEGAVAIEQLDQINSQLSRDYSVFQQYTNSDNNRAPTAMNSVFTRQNYYILSHFQRTDTLENYPAENILGTAILPSSSSTPRELILDFAYPSDRPEYDYIPTLTIGSAVYNLMRYSDYNMRPLPGDRYFINSSELNNGANINSAAYTNLDIQNKSNTTGGNLYTYVSMYILKYGIDDNFTPIFSIPTFIGVFRLPD